MFNLEHIDRNFQKDEQKFRKCTSTVEMINFFLNGERTNINIDKSKYSKCDENASRIRERGNVSFSNKKYMEALEFYTLSINSAKTAATAALAYANRSALLINRHLYNECITDIDRAIKSGYPETKRAQLISRQKEATKKLKGKKEKVSKTQNKYYPPGGVIEIHTNKKYGRHLIATEHVEIGDALLVEQPFAATMVQHFSIYCHKCLKVSYNPIPCDTCSKVVYCSDSCKRQAHETYHKYECTILRILEELFPKHSCELMLALKMTVLVKRDMKQFKEIKKLLTHSQKRPVKDLYRMSWFSSIVFTLIKEETNLFEEWGNFEKKFKELFLHNLQIIDINAVAINHLELYAEDYNSVRYAMGLYPLFSLFNHSCHPNCFFYHDGSTILVRALATIKKGDQCFISYYCTFGTMSKVKRQLELSTKYYFTCKCQACDGNWSEEDVNQQFDEPFAAVQLALLEKDPKMLRELRKIFTNRLRSVEEFAPEPGVTCLRQLVVNCYQIYESPLNL